MPEQTSANLFYLPDHRVDASLDLELRGLLSVCFTKPQDVVFRERRYFHEQPAHRWLARDPEGRLVGHIAVHEKRVESAEGVFRAGGVAEVCVHPDARGQNLAMRLLEVVHAGMAERGFAYSMLFGDRSIYEACGYFKPGNAFTGPGPDGAWVPAPDLKVKLTSGHAWPTGEVRVPGPTF